MGDVQYLEESTVLTPLKSDDLEDAAWPIFVLTDAVVYRKTQDGKPGDIANACNVDLEGPFIIQGKLDIDLQNQDQAQARTSSLCYARRGTTPPPILSTPVVPSADFSLTGSPEPRSEKRLH